MALGLPHSTQTQERRWNHPLHNHGNRMHQWSTLGCVVSTWVGHMILVAAQGLERTPQWSRNVNPQSRYLILARLSSNIDSRPDSSGASALSLAVTNWMIVHMIRTIVRE